MTSHPGGCGCETARVVLIIWGDTKKKPDLIGIFIGDLWVLTIIYRGFMFCCGLLTMTKPSSFCHYASVELFYEELDEMEVTAMLRCLELEVPAVTAWLHLVGHLHGQFYADNQTKGERNNHTSFHNPLQPLERNANSFAHLSHSIESSNP